MVQPIAQIKDRIKEGLQIREMKTVELCRRTGIPKSAMSHYTSGRVQPKQDRIYLMAKALMCDPAWLIGYDVPFEGSHSVEVEEIKHDEELKKIVDIWFSLDEEEKKTVASIIGKFKKS